MRLTRNALKCLRTRYKSILKRCCLLNSLVFITAVSFSAPASASVLNITASDGTAHITDSTLGNSTYNTINIRGSASPVIELSARLTLLGNGNLSQMITGATRADLRVLGSTLSFGSATRANGGTFNGSISLDNAQLRVYGRAGLMPVIYAVSGDSAQISGSGAIDIRSSGILQSGQVGDEQTPVSTITIQSGGRMQMRDGIWADSVDINSGSLSALSGDMHISNLTLSGEGSGIHANLGDIYLDNVSSESPDNELFVQHGITADQGNVTISGDLDLVKGLTSIIAGKDVVFAKGDASISGDGELYLKAGGNVNLSSAAMRNSSIEALRMNVTGDVYAKNVTAAQLIASSLDISNDLRVQGNSVEIFGQKVDYGILQLGDGQSRIGGDAYISDAKIVAGDLDITGSAYLSAVEGTFGALRAGKELQFAAGSLTGNTMDVPTLTIGDSEYITTLEVEELAFGNLQIGSKGLVKAGTLEPRNATLSLFDGGALELSSGNLGEENNPLESITLAGNSSLDSPGSIYANVITTADQSANNISAKGDITVFGPISGPDSLDLHVEGDLNARSIAAKSINAKNVAIDAGTLTLTGANTSIISGDITITGPGEGRSPRENDAESAGAEGYFNSLKVGGTLALAGGILNGAELQTGQLLAGSERIESVFNIENIHDGFGFGAGSNSWVTFGQNNDSWLKTVVGTAAHFDSAPNSAVGVYKPIVVGSAGVIIDPVQRQPRPQSGQLNFAPGSLLVVYADNADEQNNPKGIISAQSAMNANVQDGARLFLDGVIVNKIYGVLGENISTTYQSASAWDESKIETGSHMIAARKIEGRNGWFITEARSTDTVFPDLDPGLKPPLEDGNGSNNKPSVPSTPLEPSTPITPPSVPSTPLEPSTPTTPPSVPSTPLEPSTPTTPPSVPSTPLEPSTPTTPPSVPSTPLEPSTPTTPPSVPSTPLEPSTPTTPPSVPSTPLEPSTPITPPSDPSTPVEPDTPITPPSVPSTPVEPGTPTTPPSEPSTPVEPSTPSDPSTPVEPGMPATPDNPNPDEPGNAGEPGDAENPNQPATPDEPDVPTEPGEEEPSSPDEDQSANQPVEDEPVLGSQDKHFNSDYAGIRFLSRVTSTRYMDHDYDLITRTIESAARMAVLGAVPQMTYAANMAAVDAASSRATFSERAGNLAQEFDLNGRYISLWITPLYRAINGYDLPAYNYGYDFNGALGGAAFGADITFGDSLRIGMDASMGGGYAKSGGDLASTTNNMGFVGIGIYAGWLGNNFGISADVHYTATWNSLEQEFPAQLQMKDPTGELTARAISVGTRFEYHIPFGAWELVPHAGARFAHVLTDDYSIYSNGAMIDGEAINQSKWTFPFGIELKAQLNTESGWEIAPCLSFLATPAAGQIDANTKVHFTGVPGEGDISTQTMDYFRIGGGAGITASKDNFTLGINYAIQTGVRTTEQSVFGTLAIEF